jgi:mannose-6-phosphate isomerase
MDPELMVKYLFTTERLSIQVHPDDEAAAAAGHRRGKDEAWVVLAADRNATIGLGLCEAVSKDVLRRSALDGSIEGLVSWRPAAEGDVIYSPAGTVHALGPGLTLIEIQQNVDLTYRLYDYGRPRELHLNEAISAANPVPYSPPMQPYLGPRGREILVHGGAFVVERWSSETKGVLHGSRASPAWLIPLQRECLVAGSLLEPGSVWFAEEEARVEIRKSSAMLVAYAGGEVRPELLR